MEEYREEKEERASLHTHQQREEPVLLRPLTRDQHGLL